MKKCPCGSGQEMDTCCLPILENQALATTPEALMRARYTAHVVVNMDFVYESTHPEHRKGLDEKAAREWAEESDWLGLEIIQAHGSDKDQRGEVEFIANYSVKGTTHSHHELAFFEKKDDLWYFTDGKIVKNRPVTVNKVGRNDPRPCGSGKKYKKCCL